MKLLEIWSVILYYQTYIEIVSLEKQVLIRGRHFYALRGILRVNAAFVVVNKDATMIQDEFKG